MQEKRMTAEQAAKAPAPEKKVVLQVRKLERLETTILRTHYLG